MNPVNATSLYVSACRSVLQCDPRDPRALAELTKLLPFFRQSLSCLVCGNLLEDPIAPTNSSCQHYVCKGCKGQRMLLKPSCSWCKDYSCFQENRQLSLLVHCYRKLCLYIAHSPLAPHIAAAASDSPDLQAILNEGLSLAESEHEVEDAASVASDSANQSPSTSDTFQPDEAPPPVEEEEEESQREGEAFSLNGLHDFNGLANLDTLSSVTIAMAGGMVLKQDGLGAGLAVGVAGETGHLCDISAFVEDLKHGGGGPLLLSVEEVLRTLEPEPDPDPPQPDCPLSVPPHHSSSLNGPYCLSPAPEPSWLAPSYHLADTKPRFLPLPHPQPSPGIPHLPVRCHRKRSRSESDSEKVQPLPIASILRGGPPLEPPPHHHPHNLNAMKREPKHFSFAAGHLAPVPNGGTPKVGKAMLTANKGLKKALEHHGGGKKAYTKARQGASKPRAPRDRLPSHPHSPSKPLYKKPVEKKGCKCGRATQNPSVLTCRGQRCPCYSNRKACLDCICRGCQNSYMANGEKKLEAFAVPEKALEQTRLTLGINLTSIAAAALRGPAPSAPGSIINVTTATGTPVTAAFLSGAGHDDRVFDDSLVDMRFDC